MVESGCRYVPVGGEIGFEIARFYQANLNTERMHLDGQCFAISFDCKFGSRIETLKRNGYDAAYGTDVDDFGSSGCLQGYYPFLYGLSRKRYSLVSQIG